VLRRGRHDAREAWRRHNESREARRRDAREVGAVAIKIGVD
jgi:hypothetical protein